MVVEFQVVRMGGLIEFQVLDLAELVEFARVEMVLCELELWVVQ